MIPYVLSHPNFSGIPLIQDGIRSLPRKCQVLFPDLRASPGDICLGHLPSIGKEFPRKAAPAWLLCQEFYSTEQARTPGNSCKQHSRTGLSINSPNVHLEGPHQRPAPQEVFGVDHLEIERGKPLRNFPGPGSHKAISRGLQCRMEKELRSFPWSEEDSKDTKRPGGVGSSWLVELPGSLYLE